jgi:integrase/recombinase XerD
MNIIKAVSQLAKSHWLTPKPLLHKGFRVGRHKTTFLFFMNPSYIALTAAFKNYLQTLGFAATTCYDYPLFITTFLKYLQQKNITHITQLTTKHIYDYYFFIEQKRSERTKQTFSTAHLNRIYGATDKFLEFLHHNGMQAAPSPLKHTTERIRKKQLQVLTAGEVQQLYNAIPLTFNDFTFALREQRQAVLKLVLDLCYGCGLRRTEALFLKTTDINFEQKIIHLKQGKNYKDRLIPMSKKVDEGLQDFIYNHHKSFTRRSEYVYPFGNGAIPEALQMLTLQCSQAIQNKKPSLHTLRHSIATHLLQNGMTIESIAKFLGHSTLESTKIYTHIITEL